MGRLVIVKSVLFLSVALVLGAFTQRPKARPSDLAPQVLRDPVFQKLLSQFSGVIRVTVEGEEVFLSARSANVPLVGAGAPHPASDSLFPIASLTKQLMAVLVLKRVQDGEIALETPLAEVLGVPLTWKNIRLVNLLTHSSGIADHLNDALIENFRSLKQTPGEIFEALKKIPLRIRPGVLQARPAPRINSSASGYYSNGNYLALALILEQLWRGKTGKVKTWPQMLEEEIVKPLNLRQTAVLESPTLQQSFLPGFERFGRGYAVAPVLSASILYGSGDLVSSAEDVGRWNHQIFETDAVLKAPFRKLMLEAVSGDYTYGGRVGGSDSGLFFLRTGTLRGYRHSSAYFPSYRMSIVVLSQQDTSPVKLLTERLAELIVRAL